jgi:predicted PurR-regulated permease PerM
MSTNYLDWVEKNREYLIKQSEMLQNAIARMANNSLEVKKVGITVWAAVVGFGFTNRSAALFVLAFVAFALFGVLDVYYLYLERKFRDNFNRLARILSGYIISEDQEWIEKVKGNFLKPDNSTKFLEQIPNTLKSWANLPYLITFLITILLLVVPLPASP